MFPSADQIRDILRTAAKAELIPRFRRTQSQLKTDGSIVTEADLAMQQRVQAALAGLTPDCALLGEESPEELQKAVLSAPDSSFWCLDPLDGTSNFAAGIPCFAVSLALIVDREPALGAVYDPTHDEFFWARRGEGAWLNGERLHNRGAQSGLPLRHGIGLVDFKRLPAPLAARLAQQPPYSSQRSIGSVALDWCWIAAGRAHVYLHGKQKVWDYAAGWLILAEAGGRSAGLDGLPVFNGSFAPRSALAALDPGVFSEWQLWLAEVAGTDATATTPTVSP